jgi:hypothetical protein
MLSMPVQYRGGADFAHPHAIVQLWIDAARVTTDHYHVSQTHPQAGGSHAGHGAVPERPAEVQTAPPNAPVIAGLTWAVERAAAVAAALVVASFILFGRLPRGASAPFGLAGRTIRPEPPPPRLVAAST